MISDKLIKKSFNIENTNILENEKRTSKGIVRGIANFLKETLGFHEAPTSSEAKLGSVHRRT